MSVKIGPNNGLPESIKSALFWFVEDLSKGLLDHDDWDFDSEWFDTGKKSFDKYENALKDPSVMKLAFTVWSNNIDLSEDGVVLNEGFSQLRAFQSIRPYFDDEYSSGDISPPLQQWEILENEIEE